MTDNFQHFRDQAKYKPKKSEFAIWVEYDLDSPSKWTSSGMCFLHDFQVHINRLDKSKGADLLFIIEAATWEEACSIRNLRLYGTPYIPLNTGTSCPSCHEFIVIPMLAQLVDHKNEN